MSATNELHELAEDKIVELLKNAADDYSESISTNNQETATAYACRSMAASAIIIATIIATRGCEESELQETCDDYVHIGWCRCSACGGGLPAYPVEFCPNCGRKVRK